MPTPPKTFYPTSLKAWRDWLAKNHATETSIWIIYYKKHTQQPSIVYSDAVDMALCYGWIDSTARPIDADSYMQTQWHLEQSKQSQNRTPYSQWANGRTWFAIYRSR
jgi:uncharacterized protein YdeI (YjbR/CyaY-like superfamily)